MNSHQKSLDLPISAISNEWPESDLADFGATDRNKDAAHGSVLSLQLQRKQSLKCSEFWSDEKDAVACRGDYENRLRQDCRVVNAVGTRRADSH